MGGVVADTLDDSLQLLHVVHHHLYSILHRVQRGLGTDIYREKYLYNFSIFSLFIATYVAA